MKKFVKKLCVGLLCVCFGLTAFSAAGCKQKLEGDLTVGFYLGGYGEKWAAKLKTAFEAENPGVTINMVGDKGILGKLPGYLDAKEGKAQYDVLISHGIEWESAAIQGKLEPLDDLYKMKVEKNETVEDRVLPEFLKQSKIKGAGDSAPRYYKVPWTNGVGGLVFNRKMFDDNGWKVPTTYAELVALCQTIEDANLPVSDPGSREKRKAFVYSSEVYYWDYLVFDWILQLCGLEELDKIRDIQSPEVFNPKTSKVAQAQSKALKLWADITANKPEWTVTGSHGKVYTAAQSEFIKGNAAMMPNAQWLENEMLATINPDICVMEMMPAPIVEGAKLDDKGNPIRYSRFIGGGDSMIIPKNAPHKDLAKKFLAFMCREDNAMQFTESTHGVMLGVKYDAAKLDAIPKKTVFMDSVFKINTGSVKFSTYSPSPLKIKGKIPFEWFAGEGLAPYKDLITKPSTDIDGIFTGYYNTVKSKWAGWMKELGQ